MSTEPNGFEVIAAVVKAFSDAITSLVEGEPTQDDYALCRGGDE